jgi:N-acetylglucosaminyldiphosphoundecaprenol N-acetyl-beta-D-mannosaminyltransferase
MSEPVWIWGLPLAPLTRSAAADRVLDLVAAGTPAYFITANVHYAMLTHQVPQLRAINTGAAFLLADGAPLVWASRRTGTPLPERVAGSDLIYDLCERAAVRGCRVFFLGGADGVADEAARRLALLYPGLQVAGTAAPPLHRLSEDEHERLLAEIRATRPDILLAALGQPKGEFWIARNLERLNVPVCVQVGATLDFIAGRVRRAPLRLQKLGLEWAYRIWLEPRRLFPRYTRNAWFLLRMLARDLTPGGGGRGPVPVEATDVADLNRPERSAENPSTRSLA